MPFLGISDFGCGMSPSNNTHDSPSQFKNSPNLAYNKTKQRVPVTQAKGFPQAQMYFNRIAEDANDEMMSTPLQFQKISLVQTNKPNNGPSEFADMWKELKVKESSPSGHGTSTYPNTNTAPVHKDYREKEIAESDLMIKEGTQALREMLQIGEPQRHDVEKQQARPAPVSHGKQLSLDELFSNQSSSQVTVQQFPQLPLPLPSGNLASVYLLRWCYSFGLPPPYYHYTPAPQGVIATVELANGFKFPGSACRDQGEALESAASVALFQLPQIMPNILSPQHATMQQQFSPGFLSSPPQPVMPPAFQGFVSLPSSRVQAIHHQSSQPQPSTGNGKFTVTPIKEPLIKQGVSQPLSSSAVPFIPLQVTRRSSSCQLSSPGKPQETLLTESLISGQSRENRELDGSQQREQSVYSVKETTEEHKNVSSALLSGLSANNSCAMQDSQKTCSLPVQGTDKPSTPSRRTPRSSKRLLAPSFFAKRS
ncbi:uncharacterized protein LOC110041817 isoform X2 [Orbicella faveolata]|uniref:uncharacterized protein LOC110041817 isoform X2 n=1 Tax=Orbicella faveolata TaxID=48498 RepID=UPI0009E19394|nr:uncharacterized protein LOC110041817 isoform X2 [Orbicella faveolata]